MTPNLARNPHDHDEWPEEQEEKDEQDEQEEQDEDEGSEPPEKGESDDAGPSRLASVAKGVGSSLLGLLWIVPAAPLLLLANGRWAVPIAAWLAPLFLLRFFRSQRDWVAAIAGSMVVLPVCAAAWWRLIPLDRERYMVVAGLIGLATLTPYLVDRFLGPRLRGWGSTLLFPLAAVAVEFLVTSLSPYGTWGSIAYTQTHDLPLMQVVSVTGIWGVTFLIAWFASAANTLWERGLRDRGALVVALVFLAVWGGAYLAGGARLARRADRETVRVASFTMTPTPPLAWTELLKRPVDAVALAELKGPLEGMRASLFARASQEAKAGAQFVFWSETNAVVLDTDVDNFVSEAAGVAHDEGIYLGLAFASFTPGSGRYENRLMILDPEGEIVADYDKSRGQPGDLSASEDRHVLVVETAHGRVAAAIGTDVDFPSLVREAGGARADVLIVPASDRGPTASMHAKMAMVRGIENGFSVVRQTTRGHNQATDARGRTLAAVDWQDTRPTVMVAQVPKHGMRTAYSRVGDLFAWVCLVGLAFFIGAGMRSPKPAKGPKLVPVPAE